MFSADALDAIDEATRSLNGSVARLAIATIGRFDLSTLRDTVLATAESDPEPNLRAEALEALARMTEPSNGIVLTALHDENPTVRIAAADLLVSSLLSGEEWDEVFEVMAADQWPAVRRPLLRSAVHADDPGVDARIMAYLEGDGAQDLSSALRLFQARGHTPDPARFVALIESTEEPSVWEAAVEAVGTFGDPTMNAWLVETLRQTSDDAPLLPTLIESVGRAQAEGGRELVITFLSASATDVRRAAIRALAFFPEEEALQALIAHQAVETDPDLQQLLARIITLHERTTNWPIAP